MIPSKTMHEYVPGMKGDFAPGHARGAMPNGMRAKKANSVGDDYHKDGDLATVLSSHGPIDQDGVAIYGYFVEWDSHPGVPVFIGVREDRPRLIPAGQIGLTSGPKPA